MTTNRTVVVGMASSKRAFDDEYAGKFRRHRGFRLASLILASALILGQSTESSGAVETGGYYGKYLGPLGSYHHGVSGQVYIVDARTIHIRDFTYDGEGPAAYFYVGNTKTPGPGGIRVRDETGSLGVLKRYNKKHITLTMPEGKSLNQLKWFSVWCDEFSVNFGDVKFPRGLDHPKPQKIAALNGVHGVYSDPIVVVDAQTLLVPSFSYDGEAPDAKFWVGRGSKPTPQGIRVPDENGKQTPLRKYERKTIVLTLPGDLTVFDIDYFGVWCEAFTVDFGHVKIPQPLDVPPSLKMLGVSPQKRSLHVPSQEVVKASSRYQGDDSTAAVTTYRPQLSLSLNPQSQQPQVQHIFHPTEYHSNFIHPVPFQQLIEGPPATPNYQLNPATNLAQSPGYNPNFQYQHYTKHQESFHYQGQPERPIIQYQNQQARPELQYQQPQPQQQQQHQPQQENQALQYNFQTQPNNLPYQPQPIPQIPYPIQNYPLIEPTRYTQFPVQAQRFPLNQPERSQYQNLKREPPSQNYQQQPQQIAYKPLPALQREIPQYNLQSLQDDNVQIVPSISLNPEGRFSPRPLELLQPVQPHHQPQPAAYRPTPLVHHLLPPSAVVPHFYQPLQTNILERRSGQPSQGTPF